MTEPTWPPGTWIHYPEPMICLPSLYDAYIRPLSTLLSSLKSSPHSAIRLRPSTPTHSPWLRFRPPTARPPPLTQPSSSLSLLQADSVVGISTCSSSISSNSRPSLPVASSWPRCSWYNQSLGGDLAFMGFLTSMSSVGRLISSTVFGWMCDRYTFKFVYIVSSVICLLGNLIYLIAEWNVANSGLYTLAASRFLVSFGAGNRSVCRANVAAMTTVSQRLKYITILASVVFLGYALTPGLGSLVANVDTHFLGIHLNMFTAPGLILVVFNLLTILSMVTIYDESIGKQNGPPESPRSCVLSNPLNDPTSLPDRIISIGALVFIFLNFNARGILSVFETVNIPLFFEATGSDPTITDSVIAASNFQFYLGLIGLVTYFVIEYFNRIMSEVNWVHLGFATLTFGNVLLVIAPSDLTFLRLSIAELFIWSIGSPISTAVVIAWFSKLLGGRPQGTLMGLMGSAASVSRTILPLLPAVFSSMAPLFWINIALCVTSIFVLVWYKQLIDKSCDVESSDGETDSLTDSSA